MRYSLFLLLSIVLLAAILAGCGSLGPEQETIGSPEKSISSASEQDKQTVEASGTEAMDTPAVNPVLENIPETGEVSWSLEDGVLIISGGGELLNTPWQTSYHDATVQSITAVIVGNGITDLPYSAFMDHDSLVHVTIGDGITYIPPETFIGCTSLTQVDFGANITLIDGGAFERCGLKELTLPDTITFINMGAFSDCAELTKIKIPPSVSGIGEGVFDGCESLTIYGSRGSFAESYAKENEIPFLAVE